MSTLPSSKDTVLKLISEAPDVASIEEMMYLLYVQKKIDDGFKDIENGNTYTNEEVAKKLSEWLR